MHVDFERERAWWEERDLADEAVNRALRWREIERHLESIHSGNGSRPNSTAPSSP